MIPQSLYHASLIVHIAAGFTAFFVAPGALATRKGGLWHRRWGRIFFYAMAVVAASALMLTAIRPNLFLTMVAIFSFYSAYSGYRVLSQKRPDRGQGAVWYDWVAGGLAACAGILLLYNGLIDLQTGAMRFQPIMVVFGFLSLGLGVADLRRFSRRYEPEKHRNQWYYVHMGNMVGAYIAALTAFSATNFDFLPAVVRWLWPTAVGVPVISLWTRYYRRKFAAARKPAPSAAPTDSGRPESVTG